MSRHIADKEDAFVVVNSTPDFCRVHGKIVAFDISQILSSEKTSYSPNTNARSAKVLTVGSVIEGVRGNAGKGIHTGVSQHAGSTRVATGAPAVFVNGQPVARHFDVCAMNIR